MIQTTTHPLLNGLNEEQQQAVRITVGPVLILAGAGSGKTKTLTHRIGYLVSQGIHPHRILAVTFTNKAAQEMRERLVQLMNNIKSLDPQRYSPNTISFPWLGTFHSICTKILRQDIHYLGYNRDFTIYDQADSLAAIKVAMEELELDSNTLNPRAVQTAISGAKNELINPKDYMTRSEGFFMEQVGAIYRQYQATLKKSQALDFDDLLMKTLELFKNHPSVLKKWQNQFEHILIDEYQDTNVAQYQLIKALASHENICVVGDDYQAIYGWRGANFKNILNFEKDWPRAQTIKLEQNYRSTQNILDAADAVIKNNFQRTEKTLWTNKGSGTPITLFEAQDSYDEVEFIITELLSLKRKLYPKLNHFAILYRTNAQSRILEEALLKRNIAYRLVGAVQFYQRKEVKDILAYLKFLANPHDTISLQRAVHTPKRGIGKITLEKIYVEGFETMAQKNKKVNAFAQLIKKLHQFSLQHHVSALIDEIIEATGYRLMLLEEGEEGMARLENVKELKSVAENYENLSEFLEAVSLVSDIDNYDPNHDAVTLMTLHNAKGLEFPVVFIVGMEEGIFPHSRSLLDPNALEEERRLCYVGITRAKERLYLLRANSRLLYGSIQANMASRFLNEIPDELKEIL